MIGALLTCWPNTWRSRPKTRGTSRNRGSPSGGQPPPRLSDLLLIVYHAARRIAWQAQKIGSERSHHSLSRPTSTHCIVHPEILVVMRSGIHLFRFGNYFSGAQRNWSNYIDCQQNVSQALALASRAYIMVHGRMVFKGSSGEAHHALSEGYLAMG